MTSNPNKMIVTAVDGNVNHKSFMMHAFKNAARMDEYDSPSGLPSGWRRRCVMRKSGASAGQYDVYYYSPDGKRFRSKKEIARYLEKIGGPLDIKAFDFRRAELSRDPLRRKERPEPFVAQKPTLSKMIGVSTTGLNGNIHSTSIYVKPPCKMPVVMPTPLDTNSSNNNVAVSCSTESESVSKSNAMPNSLGNIVQKLWQRKLNTADSQSVEYKTPQVSTAGLGTKEHAPTSANSSLTLVNPSTCVSSNQSVSSSGVCMSPTSSPSTSLAMLQNNLRLLTAWKQFQQSTAYPFVPTPTMIPTPQNAKIPPPLVYSVAPGSHQQPILSPLMGMKQSCFAPTFMPFFPGSPLTPVLITPPGTPLPVKNFASLGSHLPNSAINVPIKSILTTVSVSPK